MKSLPACLFVTGTDTEVGKTVVTASLAASLGGEVRALKPVATGVPAGLVGEDAELLGLGAGHAPLVMRTWEPPISPHRAADLSGETLSLKEVLQWIEEHSAPHTLVEGVGGWRVPVSWEFGVSDLAVAWGAPVLVVSANRLGTLNHTLLTVEAILGRGLSVWGVVLNDGIGAVEDGAREHNHADLQQLLGDVPVIRMPRLIGLERERLVEAGRVLRMS